MCLTVAGRVMTRRVMGKLAFFTSHETGPIRLFLKKQRWGLADASLVDAGDWIGVKGTCAHRSR